MPSPPSFSHILIITPSSLEHCWILCCEFILCFSFPASSCTTFIYYVFPSTSSSSSLSSSNSPLPPLPFIPRTPSHYDHSPLIRTTHGVPTARLKWTETVSRTWDFSLLTSLTSQMATTTSHKSFMRKFFPQKSTYGTNFWITILSLHLTAIARNRGCIKLLALQICGRFAHLLLNRRPEHCCMDSLQDLVLVLILQI